MCSCGDGWKGGVFDGRYLVWIEFGDEQRFLIVLLLIENLFISRVEMLG